MAISPQMEIIISVIVYSITSGTMLLLNKLAVHYMPYPSIVSSIQIASSLVIVYGMQFVGLVDVDKIQWKYVVPYCAFVTTFVLGILCNMHSLETSNVETVIVFRSLTPCGVAFLDFFFLGRELPSARSWGSLLLIVFGTLGYSSTDEKFQTQGYSAYAWPFMYFVVMCVEMCVAKKVISDVDLKTLSGPVAYTNLLGLLPMLIFAMLGNEFNRMRDDLASDTFIVNDKVILFLVLSSIAGTAIGYAGWWCRDKVAATSFTLIGVINKCLTILLNLLIWDNHAPPMGIAALLVCLCGGTLYQQAPMRKAKTLDEESADDNGKDTIQVIEPLLSAEEGVEEKRST